MLLKAGMDMLQGNRESLNKCALAAGIYIGLAVCRLSYIAIVAASHSGPGAFHVSMLWWSADTIVIPVIILILCQMQANA